MARFYPKGFIGSERALITIASTRDPQRWKPDAMVPEEQGVWDKLGPTLNATWIYDHLPYYVAETRRDGTMDRYCDFMAALEELRKSLFAGEITAYFTHEDGRLDHIFKEGWGGDEAEDILLSGIVDLSGGVLRRVILFKGDDVAKLAQSLPPAWSAKIEPRDNGNQSQTIKRPASEKREAFKNWRDSLNGRIPTLAEDIVAMRNVGINREDARELRRDHPSLPRGKPKTKSAEA